jgi:hypothetical protein
MFQLAKWYLDLVTDEGIALVGYAARLRWGALRLRYASLLRSEPGSPATEDVSLRGTEPALEGDILTWRHGPLGVDGRWERQAPPIAAHLASLPSGDIHWHCLVPNAQVTLRLGDRTLAGRGYAERLELTLPPHELPFRTLHWGRHLSGQHALVWITWEGRTAPASWIWLDGALQPSARLSQGGITGLPGGLELCFDPPRTLRGRSVLTELARPLPALLDRVVGPVARMHERKLLARSALIQDGAPLDRGWAIHEEVRW